MNKRKLRRVAIVALVLVLLCNTLGVQASTKKDDPRVIVKDYGSLYTAIAEAKDNDVIGIQGTITIPAIVDLNMSENKAVILRRMEAGAKLVVSGDYGADNKASFRDPDPQDDKGGTGGTGNPQDGDTPKSGGIGSVTIEKLADTVIIEKEADTDKVVSDMVAKFKKLLPNMT